MNTRLCAGWKWVVGALLVAVAVSTVSAEDEKWSRAYRFELYPVFQMLGGDTVPADGGAVDVEIESAPLYGAGMGVNVGNHFNLNTEFLAGRTDLVGTMPGVPGVESRLGLTTWLWNANLDYNILDGRLTPLVTGGLGVVNFHNHAEHRDESHLSFNLGAGARWDITDHIALRVLYRWLWMDELENVDDPFQFNCVEGSVIFMFK
jgi:opacity protein-like surface antigen